MRRRMRSGQFSKVQRSFFNLVSAAADSPCTAIDYIEKTPEAR